MVKKILLCSMLTGSFNFVSASESQIEPDHEIIIQHIKNGIALREALETLVLGIHDIYASQSNFTEHVRLQELDLQAEPFISKIQSIKKELQDWNVTLSRQDLYKLSAKISDSHCNVTAQLQNAHLLLDLLHEK